MITLYYFQQVQSLKCVAYLYQLYRPNSNIYIVFTNNVL